ncbi:MAG: hypothetical protein ACK50J_04850 [Planctomyces sp.]|jgi:hypothetical protein
MSQQKVTSTSGPSREACAPAVEHVLSVWSGDSKSDLPEEVRKHLFGCSHCLRLWIALEAAAELAAMNRGGSQLQGQ